MKLLKITLLMAAMLFSAICLKPGHVEAACGDVNNDGVIDISDALYLLSHLFLGGPSPDCGEDMACANVNEDEVVDISDAVYLLMWLFLGGPEPVCENPCKGMDCFTFIGDNEQGYPEYVHDQTGIVFVLLPGGTFNMGSPENEGYRWYGEGPVHEVTLSPFLIGKYEVTQGQWNAVMGYYPSAFDGTIDADFNPVNPPDNRDNLPVERVSWNDIQAFEEKTGLTLPTEAQWEYACRAGTETAFSFGPLELCKDWLCVPCPERDAFMWYCGTSGSRTHEVGTKEANAFGLHNMHGNVMEWCEDWWKSDFYAESAGALDPICTDSGSGQRIYRGGYWKGDAKFCRSALRLHNFPDHRYTIVGFRLSWSI